MRRLRIGPIRCRHLDKKSRDESNRRGFFIQLRPLKKTIRNLQSAHETARNEGVSCGTAWGRMCIAFCSVCSN